MKLKKIASIIAGITLATSAIASDNSKVWDATDKAKQFIKENIVLDFFASPYGVGWTKPEQLHEYLNKAHEAGITGASATLAPTYYTFDQLSLIHI